MSTLSFGKTVSINDLRKLIPLIGADLSVVIKSEPGCGKSSILKMLEQDNGDVGNPKPKYEYVYVDCPLKDIPDVGMNIPNHETRTLEYYTASLFRMNSDTPKIIMLDEMLKAPKMLQVLFTRLLLERMVGDKALPDGSIVFATSNNESDGVGDQMMAHAGNRVCIVEMAKPTVREWIEWASINNINPVVMAFVEMYPRCMDSYRTTNDMDNPYIFNPKKAKQLSFVSPRSLALSSAIVNNAGALGENVTQAALTGTLGEAAAADMAAFIGLQKTLPSHREIMNDPNGAVTPHEAAGQILLVLNAVQHIEDQDDITAYVTYFNRFKSVEIQSLFFSQALKHPKLLALNSIKNAAVAAWAKANYQIM